MSGAASSLRCPVCGELNDGRKSICWMCRSTLESARSASTDGSPLIETSPPESPQLLSASVVLTVTLLLVILGAGLIWPGIGIAMAIVLVIPFVRTALVSSRRAARGAEDAFPTTISLFLGSMVTTFIIITVVGVIGFGTFCLTCFGIAVKTEDVDSAALAAALLALVILTPVCIRLGKWVAKRWRRDVGRR